MSKEASLHDIHSKQTYEAIRVASQEIISEKGIDKLTIREICKRANVSIGTFYNYFSSKEDLILHRYKSIDDYFTKIEKQLLKNNEEWINLCQFAKSYGYFVEKYASIEFSRKILQARLTIERDAVLDIERPIYKILTAIFKNGQDKGVFRKDLSSEEMCNMTLLLLRGYHYEYVLRMNESYFIKSMETYFPIWATCFLSKEQEKS